jgi:NADH-quinone oxidoreductase subunit N
MPADAIASFHPRDFFALTPEIVLAFWGLVVLALDLGPFRKWPANVRMRATARVAMVGSLLALLAATLQVLVRLDMRFGEFEFQAWFNLARIDYSDPDPLLFFGTVSCDVMTDILNLLFTATLALVVWGSTVWGFTENWGEYFALLLWSTVGMMLLAASEELLTLFLTLETMTICLYLMTAFEKSKRRSAEGGLKYFIYGSVSSALFLFGLSMVYGLTGSTQFPAVREALLPSTGAMAGLAGNVAGATAVLLMLVGFGFKVAAVPFHQWAPDAYEGAPAPVTAWVATGSKVASFVALMKVLLHALGPWASTETRTASPGWIGVVAVLAAASMTYGNFAALAQTNFKRMLAYSSIAHAGYMLVGVAAAGVSPRHAQAAGAVLFYLVVYAFSNLGAFALASWLARDKGSDDIADLDGLAARAPGLATCTLLLMLSLIGMPPLAGFFGKLYMFMEALDESNKGRLTLMWLVALGLLNSVVSAFYYVRVLKAMYLREESGPALRQAPSPVTGTILLATAVTLGFGLFPKPLMDVMTMASVAMLTESSSIGLAGVKNKQPSVSTSTMRLPEEVLAPVARPKGVTPPPAPKRSPRAGTSKKAAAKAEPRKAEPAKGAAKAEPKKGAEKAEPKAPVK